MKLKLQASTLILQKKTLVLLVKLELQVSQLLMDIQIFRNLQMRRQKGNRKRRRECPKCRLSKQLITHNMMMVLSHPPREERARG